MKIRKPGRKKNKNEMPQTDSAVFDFTLNDEEDRDEASTPVRRGGRAERNAEKNSRKRSKAKKHDDTFGLLGKKEDAFEVSVRNADPLLRRLDAVKAGSVWLGDLQINIAAAAIIVAMFSLLLMAADYTEMIFFALPAIPVFLAITTLESLEMDKIRLYAAAAGAAALIVGLIVLRKYIGNGWAIIMNSFYDAGEEAQAYIYDRFSIGNTGVEHPNRSMHFALIWGSCALALLASLPHIERRRGVTAVLGCFTMLAFAYYGLIPETICIAVFIVALVFAMSRGHIISSIPVLLVVMIVFGGIWFADPGESYTISRADENFRDKFALSSTFLQKPEESIDILSLQQDVNEQKEEEEQNNEAPFFATHKNLTIIIVLVLILAAVAAAVFMFVQRIRKRQAEHRRGINSSDPREAITAMFPYAVRWLQPAGIEISGKPFPSLLTNIRADISEEYAERYMNMYDLWKEAAYSDHDMTDEKRIEMNSFMQDTISMIKDKSDLNTRIMSAIKYAL